MKVKPVIAWRGSALDVKQEYTSRTLITLFLWNQTSQGWNRIEMPHCMAWNVGYFTFNILYITFCSPTFHTITRHWPTGDREGTASTCAPRSPNDHRREMYYCVIDGMNNTCFAWNFEQAEVFIILHKEFWV